MTWSWETSVVRSRRKCPFRAESYVLERSSTGVMTVLSCVSAVGRQAVLEKDGRGCLVAWVKGSPEGTGKPPKKDARDVQNIWLVPEKGVLDGQLATGVLSHGRHRMSIRAARERSSVWLSPGKAGTHSPFPRQVSGWSSAKLRGLYLCVNAPVEVVTPHTVLITESALGSNTAAGLFPTRLSRRGWRPSWRAWERERRAWSGVSTWRGSDATAAFVSCESRFLTPLVSCIFLLGGRHTVWLGFLTSFQTLDIWCWDETVTKWHTADTFWLSNIHGLMLKLKRQYFGHLVWRTDSLEKTFLLGKIEGRRRKGRQGMRWLDGITDSMDMSLRNPGSWWWTGKPGVGSLSEMTEQLNWTEQSWVCTRCREVSN